MTLTDLVTYVCLQMNRTDTDSRIACQQFLNARYKTIYDAYPWRDSELVSDPITIGPPVALDSPIILPPPVPPPDPPGTQNGMQSFPFPSGMERIVKVGLISTVGNGVVLTDLRPSDSASLMETRPDVLLSNGIPEFYEELNTVSNGRVINLYPVCNVSGYQILVVGKKQCNNLVNSNDTPILRNIDNVLIAYALADMLKRDRHYAKAAQQLQEAQTLLQEAISLEQNQSNAPRAARPLSVTGGTLAELTDAVSSRLSLWDANSQNKILEAIRRNYQSLYDRELWTESVVILSMQAQDDILILPPYVDRIISVRSDVTASPVDVVELEYIFRTDPDLIYQQGSPARYAILPAVAVSVLPELAEQLSLVSDNSDDAFSVYVYGEAEGIDRRENVSVTAGTGVTAFEYDTPLVISKPKSLGTLTISGASSLIKYGEIPPELSSVQQQRLMLLPGATPETANTYYAIIGKRKLQQLISPNDAVNIRGCESALIAMACGDVAQGDQAAAFKAEAQGHIDILITKETNQQSRRVTITPYTDRCDYSCTDWMN